MSEAPSDVSLKQLKELGIKIEKDDEKWVNLQKKW
jgi:hypothetical protein